MRRPCRVCAPKSAGTRGAGSTPSGTVKWLVLENSGRAELWRLKAGGAAGVTLQKAARLVEATVALVLVGMLLV